MARDGARGFAPQLCLIVALNLVGLLAAAASLGGVILYVRHAESGQPIDARWFTVPMDGDLATLLLYGGVVALVGVISALCLYFTEWQIMQVTRAYEQQCAQRVLALAGDPMYAGWADAVEGEPRAAITRLVHAGARFTAFAFRDLLRLILPALTFLATLAYLAYVDLWLTLLLAPLAVVYLAPLYLVNRRVARNQVEYRQRSPGVRRAIFQRVRALFESPSPAEADPSPFSEPSYRAMAIALYSRMIADKRVQFLNTTFFVLCLFGLFVFFGFASHAHDRPWADLLAYLVVLRFAVGALRQVSGLFVKFSRFFPEYRAYSDFVDVAERLAAQRRRGAEMNPSLPSRLTVHVDGEPRWDSPASLAVETSQVLWMLTPRPIGLVELQTMAARLSARLAPAFDLVPHAAFYTTLPLARAPMGPAVAFLSAQAEGLTEEAVDELLAKFGDGYLVLLDQGPDRALGPVGQKIGKRTAGVIVFDGRRAIAAGDLSWLKAHMRSVKRLLEARAEAILEGQRRLGDDDEDDEAAMM